MTRIVLSFSVSTLALLMGLLVAVLENGNYSEQGRLDRTAREYRRTLEENKSLKEEVERLEYSYSVESRMAVAQN